MKYVWGYSALLVTNVLIGYLVYLWFPSYRHYLVKEDSLIETMSAIIFLCSCFLALLYFMIQKKNGRTYVLISAIGLAGFLDELSFGQRMFGFSTPCVYDISIDGIHDFFYLGCKIFYYDIIRAHAMYAYLFTGIVAIIIIAAISLYWSKLSNIASRIFLSPPGILFLFFAILIFSALIIDLDRVQYDPLFMFEELFEMNAAIALFFCCLSLPNPYEAPGCQGHKTALAKKASPPKRHRSRG